MRSEAMLEQTLAVDEPRPRLRGPLAPVRVVLGAGKGVGQGIGHALERIARRGQRSTSFCHSRAASRRRRARDGR